MDTTAVSSYTRENEHNSTKDKYTEASHARNANSRTIFSNAVLTCQFLKGYAGFSFFSDLKPEDIEDVTEHYRAFLGVEFEADTVKKVTVRMEGKEREVYVISLIEHKSSVDYDVAMQLLRYMTVIWYDYKKRQNAVQEGSSSRKSFRYPLIIPVVYYEGSAKWTADMCLSDRIECSDLAPAYVPNFTYRLVNLHAYSNGELERHRDEMSLLMMCNRVQTAMDYAEFLNTSKDFIDKIYRNMPEDIKEIYREVLWSLLIKMNVPTEKAQKMMKQLEENGMGVLFADMKFDIQEEWRKTRDAEQKALDAEQKAQDAEQKAQDAEQKALNAEQKAQDAEQKALDAKQKALDAELKMLNAEQKAQDAELRTLNAEQKAQTYLAALVSTLLEQSLTREEAAENLQRICGITKDEAIHIVDQFSEQK